MTGIKVIDPCQDKLKLYDATTEVPQVGADGKPTGSTVQVPKITCDREAYATREAWLADRIKELDKQGKASMVVVRGSHDDVIGIVF